MAKFLPRKGIVYNLDKIIDEAAEELILISPYIKADDETKSRIEKSTRHGTRIDVIYGKSQSERNLGNVKASFDIPGITVHFLKDLHAKCYLNEKEALVTSMNLHEFSQEHNDEMGILVSKREDSVLYEAIYQEANRLLRAADIESPTSSESKPNLKAPKARAQTKNKAEKKPSRGFCIRCKAGLAADPEKPYCADCYSTWRRYSDPDYEDNYCHICGKEHAATMLKPLCASCYKKYKDMFQFAAA